MMAYLTRKTEIQFGDVVVMNVPLLIRILELAREDINSDAELHLIAEKLTDISKRANIATMSDYYCILEYLNVRSK
jgi:hypothetical protein